MDDLARQILEKRTGEPAREKIRRDYEKNNLAQLAGWRCLMFDGEMVRSGEAVEIVRKALELK